jgi:hypothetical protein
MRLVRWKTLMRRFDCAQRTAPSTSHFGSTTTAAASPPSSPTTSATEIATVSLAGRHWIKWEARMP